MKTKKAKKNTDEQKPNDVAGHSIDGPGKFDKFKILKARRLRYKQYKREQIEQKLQKMEAWKERSRKEAEAAEARKKLGRKYTVSIAVPGSILKNMQTRELGSYLVGEVARAATVFNIDEIIVFDDFGTTRPAGEKRNEVEQLELSDNKITCLRMARILQYLECPQYMRKKLFPIHRDLEFAGLLNPLESVHHLRETQWCTYREGIVTEKLPRNFAGSMIDVGLKREVHVTQALNLNVRVTVKFKESNHLASKKLSGTLVSPHVPRTEAGLYWGYTVRVAHSLGSIFLDCPFDGGYDMTVGTSERGSSVDNIKLPSFKHMLIVFGGPKGLDASLEADERLKEDDPKHLFHYYLNTCPGQGSLTIRTEEAILITLASLRPKITDAQMARDEY